MWGNVDRRFFCCPACDSRLSLPKESTATRIHCPDCGVDFPASAAKYPPRPLPGVAAGICILAAVGFIISIQPVTLFTGTGTVWIGVAIIGASAAAAFFLPTRLWVKVAASTVLVVALINALFVEHEASNRRDEISHLHR